MRVSYPQLVSLLFFPKPGEAKETVISCYRFSLRKLTLPSLVVVVVVVVGEIQTRVTKVNVVSTQGRLSLFLVSFFLLLSLSLSLSLGSSSQPPVCSFREFVYKGGSVKTSRGGTSSLLRGGAASLRIHEPNMLDRRRGLPEISTNARTATLPRSACPLKRFEGFRRTCRYRTSSPELENQTLAGFEYTPRLIKQPYKIFIDEG